MEAAGIEDAQHWCDNSLRDANLTAHQPEILRELDPAASLHIPRRAGWNRGFMAT